MLLFYSKKPPAFFEKNGCDDARTLDFFASFFNLKSIYFYFKFSLERDASSSQMISVRIIRLNHRYVLSSFINYSK